MSAKCEKYLQQSKEKQKNLTVMKYLINNNIYYYFNKVLITRKTISILWQI